MPHVPNSLGAPGLLFPALLGAAYFSRCLGQTVFFDQRQSLRVLGGLTLALAFYTGSLLLLLYANQLRLSMLVLLFVASLLAAHVLARRKRVAPVSPERSGRRVTLSALPLFATAGAALSLASLAAYWLPVWHWDSLGYHLPFVNFVLQGGGFAELPRDVPYLSTYPRNVELLFTALRATLPDDRLVDCAQIPFGIIGALSTAGIARVLGAHRIDGLCAGSLWLLLPAVFLQLPTNYIDVATASFFLLAVFFLLVETNRRTLLCAGLAIGLFLGTKPSAPPAALLLLFALLFRARRAHRLGIGFLAVGLAGALGMEAYVTELVRHGNPVWPATVAIGPFELPGTISMKELLSSGAGAQKVVGSLPVRVWLSWSSLDARPLFDMRKGGLGVAFWASVPLALYSAYRQPRVWPLAFSAIALVTPDPAVVRYVLAFPAMLFALAFASLASLSKTRAQVIAAAVRVVAAGLGLQSLVYAAPGLHGEGPPLLEYANLSWPERAVAVGANGPPGAFVAARERLRAGDVAVYDRALWLPYLMWRSDLQNRVVRIPEQSSNEALRRVLNAPRVRLVAAGTDQSTLPTEREMPNRFEPLFESREPCVVFWKR
jgi:hypothetical protein